MNISKSFDDSEFICPCCGKVETQQDLIDRLQAVRDSVKMPIKITSGYRCQSYNSRIGGKDDSSHMKGLPVDIAVDNSWQRFKLIKAALQHFNRIGIGGKFIHLDCDPDKSSNLIWWYNY